MINSKIRKNIKRISQNIINFATSFLTDMTMQIEVLKSKIHRVRVTQADLNYIGSVTIDEQLMEAAGIIENERVYIYDINNGERFDTYAIKGEKGSGIIGLNGAAARKVQVDDLLIIVSFAQMDFEEAKNWKPTVIFPKNNKI